MIGLFIIFFGAVLEHHNNRGPKFKKLAYYFKFISKIPKNFNDIIFDRGTRSYNVDDIDKNVKMDLVEVLMTNQIVCFYY